VDGVGIVTTHDAESRSIDHIRRAARATMTPDDIAHEEERWRATLAVIGGLDAYLRECGEGS
jgi:hypothetical protein